MPVAVQTPVAAAVVAAEGCRSYLQELQVLHRDPADDSRSAAEDWHLGWGPHRRGGELLEPPAPYLLSV